MASIVVFFLSLAAGVATGQPSLLPPSPPPSRACDIPAIYNFGDSNSDTGGIAAAFYPPGPPSGETFFKRPVGRASDGRLIIDFVAEKLGLSYLSAYLDSIKADYTHGANFATGGATIRRVNESWFVNDVSPFSLDIQVEQFNQFKDRTIYLPEDFAKAIYTIDIGQNDIAYCFRTLGVEASRAAIPDIVNQFATSIQQLYGKGARAFWIHNTGPIGCLPVTYAKIHDPPRGYLDKTGCVAGQNVVATEFNKQLKAKVIQLRSDLAGAVLTYVDMYSAKYQLIANAKDQGFNKWSTICCGYHDSDEDVYCGNQGKINGTEVFAGSCKDPTKVISWDGVHYTEAANNWIAIHITDGSFSDPPFSILETCPNHISVS
ncbi:Lipase, GDSL [Cynara cardunculus var. scolymus]|uniref:Lipase, GDSL n=1 Tax=Cynara cardunculus var. scolymus TaxID=59895 RepID=A0A118K1A8_CYNCS|nr:Lipase, GDSL [Cynara cardunculus var. scolymus]